MVAFFIESWYYIVVEGTNGSTQMNTMTENVEVIIANLDSKYKEANNITNECSEDCWVRFFLDPDDRTISYEDEWSYCHGFKTMQEAIEACIGGLKNRVRKWALSTRKVDYDSLQIGWQPFETYQLDWEDGDIGAIMFTIAMNRCDE